jgi:hypothetical protein
MPKELSDELLDSPNSKPMPRPCGYNACRDELRLAVDASRIEGFPQSVGGAWRGGFRR